MCNEQVPKSGQLTVIHLVSGLGVGGAENFILRLLKSEKKMKHFVICLSSVDGLRKNFENNGVQVVFFPLDTLITAPINFINLIRFVYRLKPQTLVGWMYHGCFLCLIYKLIFKSQRIVWNIRHTPILPLDKLKYTKLFRLIFLFLSRSSMIPESIVFNSYESQRVHGILGFSGNQDVIWNGLGISRSANADDRALESSAKARTLVLGQLARYHPMKNHLALLEALSIVRNRGFCVRLILAGLNVDEQNPELLGKIRELGLLSCVELMGLVDDSDDFYEKIDVLVIPSAWGEACPNVLIEAMFHGKYVVATDVGDNSRLLNGFGSVVGVPTAEKIALGLEEVMSKFVNAEVPSQLQIKEYALATFKLETALEKHIEHWGGLKL